jgi:hypothetical protein
MYVKSFNIYTPEINVKVVKEQKKIYEKITMKNKLKFFFTPMKSYCWLKNDRKNVC